MAGHDVGVCRAGRETTVLLAADDDVDEEPGQQRQLSSSVAAAHAAGTQTAAAADPVGRHAAARVFLTGEYIDKGYRHTPPLYGPPTVHDRAHQLMVALWVLFSALLLGGLVVAAGWEVDIIDSAAANTSASPIVAAAGGEHRATTFSETENFCVLCVVVAVCGPGGILGYFANSIATLLLMQHSHAGMRTMPDEEIIARYLDAEVRPLRRLTMLIMGAWAAVPLAVPISGAGMGYQFFVVVYCGSFAAIALLTGGLQRYSIMGVGVALRYIKTRTSINKWRARIIMRCVWVLLFSMVLLAVAAGRIITVDLYEVGTSIVTGKKHCELNLLAIPTWLAIVVIVSGMAETSGVSMQHAVEQLQFSTRHACLLLLAAVTAAPHVVNMAALVNGADEPDSADFCQAVAWGCFGPLVLEGAMIFWLFSTWFVQCIDQYLDLRCSRVISNQTVGSFSRITQAQTAGAEQTTRWSVQGRYAAFVSHYKAEAATEARHLKDKLTTLLSSPVFLDSDDLSDLRNLLDAVAQSDVLVLLQTTNLLTRPWCLLEIYTALLNNVPIVTIAVKGAFVYSFEDAWEMLGTADASSYSFADELDKRNPGAAMVIREQRIPVHGKLEIVDIAAMGKALREHVPHIISKDYAPAASFRTIEAQLEDIVETMAEVVQAGRTLGGVGAA